MTPSAAAALSKRVPSADLGRSKSRVVAIRLAGGGAARTLSSKGSRFVLPRGLAPRKTSQGPLDFSLVSKGQRLRTSSNGKNGLSTAPTRHRRVQPPSTPRRTVCRFCVLGAQIATRACLRNPGGLGVVVLSWRRLRPHLRADRTRGRLSRPPSAPPAAANAPRGSA